MTSIQLGVLLVQLAATISMVGLIWFVQVVHYPLFAFVGSNSFVRYEVAHRQLTTYVVAPLMLAELISAILLLGSRPAAISLAEAVTGILLLAIIWGSTIAVQVPLHTRLSQSHDPTVLKRLVRSNWLRTVGWSLRGLLVLRMVAGLLPLAS